MGYIPTSAPDWVAVGYTPTSRYLVNISVMVKTIMRALVNTSVGSTVD